MTPEELSPIVAALAVLDADGRGEPRLREIIIDDALGCDRCRREYAALVLRLADPSRPSAGRIELTAEDFARTGAAESSHSCARGGGSCAIPG